MKVVKTNPYIDKLCANRARDFAEVLNEENVITVKRQYVKNGKWSHYSVTWFGKPPLYIISYHHSTHPVPGSLRIDKYTESENPETIYYVSGGDDVAEPLPEELEPYRETIVKWFRRFMPALFDRTILLSEEWQKHMSREEIKKAEIRSKLVEIRGRYGLSTYGVINATLLALGFHPEGREFLQDVLDAAEEIRKIKERYGYSKEELVRACADWFHYGYLSKADRDEIIFDYEEVDELKKLLG